MLTRHQVRELVLQALFNLDFKQATKNTPKQIFDNIFYTFYAENGSEKIDVFAKNLFFGILKEKEIIDRELAKNTKMWSFEKTALIDKNILRIGYFEMFFVESVPPRVAINEAIELAKTFGQKNSYKFVSGILGNIYESSGLKKSDNLK